MSPGDGAPDGEILTEILVRDGDRLTLRARKIAIDVVSGPNAGQNVELPALEIRVGSAPGCDLLLMDPAVSRHHFTIRADAHGIRVVDAGSRNGTTVDGVRVRDAYARPDSSILAGNTAMRLRFVQGVVEVPLSSRESFGGLLGKSIPMRQVFTLLERVAPTDDTVLVEGETGTGKEIAAEAIHEESPRAGGPFVVFDCSAVSANLIESELFGHVRGSFTGATSDRAGAFEAANEGTLFLDEVGELPLELQPRLLRLLERREVRRVGSTTPKPVDVRIVAATNRNLAEEVAAGRFREDLYYRLAVARVTLPPLRERPDDIPLLAAHFAVELARRGGPAPELPDRTMRQLQAQAWPGNVRELRNAVARVFALGDLALPAPSQEPPPTALTIDLSSPLKTERDRAADAVERAYLIEALKQTGGNVSKAADLAKVNRKFVQRALKRYGLRARDDD